MRYIARGKNVIWRRFLRRVQKTDTCWLWTGTFNKATGYGSFPVKHGQPDSAHKVSYILFKGLVPDKLWVLHIPECNNRLCVNPAHLYLGTPHQNNTDTVNAGHHWQKRKTHCPQGHSYSGANLYTGPSGHRQCRECTRTAARETIRRKMATTKG